MILLNNAKRVFLAVMRVYVGLVLLRRVFNPGFLASYWSPGFGRFLQLSALASHWWRIVQILQQRQRKTTNTAPNTLSAVQASSQSTFINE
jgi:hypothetical protein